MSGLTEDEPPIGTEGMSEAMTEAVGGGATAMRYACPLSSSSSSTQSGIAVLAQQQQALRKVKVEAFEDVATARRERDEVRHKKVGNARTKRRIN